MELEERSECAGGHEGYADDEACSVDVHLLDGQCLGFLSGSALYGALVVGSYARIYWAPTVSIATTPAQETTRHDLRLIRSPLECAYSETRVHGCMGTTV